MEDLELLFLVVGGVALLREALRRSPLSPAIAAAAFLYLVLCLRELDLRNTLAPAALIYLLGKGRHLWVTCLGCLVAGDVWPQRRQLVRALRREDWRVPGRILAMCLFLFGLSWLATRKWAFHQHATREFFEEACELPMELGLMLLAFLLVAKARAAREKALGYANVAR